MAFTSEIMHSAEQDARVRDLTRDGRQGSVPTVPELQVDSVRGAGDERPAERHVVDQGPCAGAGGTGQGRGRQQGLR